MGGMSFPAAPESTPPSAHVGDGLDALRADVRDFTRSVDALIVSPDDETALGRLDRARIALAVATANASRPLVDRFSRTLAELDDADGASIVGDSGRWSAFGQPTEALLEYAELTALDPDAAGADEIATLTGHGVGAATIVAAAQVVAYVSYLARLLQGMAAIGDSGPGSPGRSDALPGFASTLGPEETAFPVYTWLPSVPPAAVPADTGSDEKTPAKWSPFYLTLLHDPLVLGERTALYNAIMTGTGALDRADRELAALATSLVTGCEYCASVHGRRQVQLSSDPLTAVALARSGPDSLASERQRAIVAVAAAAAVTPPSVTPWHIALLHDAGLDDDAVRDLIAVAAMFAWANRLMMTLGSAAR